MPMTTLELRKALRDRGYLPVPCRGKRPIGEDWPNLAVDDYSMARWAGLNTGVRTKTTTALDADITDPDAATAVEETTIEWFEGRGKIPIRFGRSPKRAMFFRAAIPFPKMVQCFRAPNGEIHKIEILGDGQQIIVAGIHPDTKEPYTFHGDPLWNIERAELVEVTEQEMRQLLDYLSDLLVSEFRYEKVSPNGKAHTTGTGDPDQRDPVDAGALLDSIVDGASANDAQMRIIPSLLRKGQHPAEVLEFIVTETVARGAALGWTREKETRDVIRRVLAGYNNVLLKDYSPDMGVPDWLPGEFHQDWASRLDAGRFPGMAYNRGGFYVRSRQAEREAPRESHTRQEPGEPRPYRFKLVPFADMRPGPEQLYLVDELIPVAGLVDVWGKAKCYKSFWCLDLMLHVAMGWEYRDRCVQHGTVVYFAFEGGHGYKKRVEALRRHYDIADDAPVPLHIVSGKANLIADHKAIIADVTAQLGDTKPAAIVLDTLNKSLHGSESSDEDMGNYVRAAEALRDAFACVVIIVHHCGYDETHPRGHTSLPGAVDAQLHVLKLDEETLTVTVEFMRDGPEDIEVASKMEVVEVGEDCTGKVLTSLVVTPSHATARHDQKKWPPSMTVFHDALRAALKVSGEAFYDDVFSDEVRAVDLNYVREDFYRRYVADGDTAEARQATRQKAFKRSVTRAQENRLAHVRVEPSGRELIWLVGSGGE